MEKAISKKLILFSPLGTTDPISNGRDGSMLHISRVYSPDDVVLYLSKEIVELHNKDNRYLYTLERLEEEFLGGKKIKKTILEDDGLSPPHLFDPFLYKFDKILQNIKKKNPNSEILINISSGTASMKSALYTLSALNGYRPIQVASPVGKSNPRRNNIREYEPDIEWVCNEDNVSEKFKNRCIESKIDEFSARINKKILKEHIGNYNYSAGLTHLKSMQDRVSQEAVKMIEAASYRLQLDFSAMDSLCNDMTFDPIPIKSGNHKMIFEYALALKIKLARKEYGDFLRALTPLIFDLFELILENNAKIRIDEYCKYIEEGSKNKPNKVRLRIWDIDKLEKNNEIRQILDQAYDGFKVGYVLSDHVNTLIQVYCKDIDGGKLVEETNKIREIEKNIRNIAAHEIASFTEDTIKKKSGYRVNEIMTTIKYLLDKAGIKASREAWTSYDQMNQMIIDAI